MRDLLHHLAALPRDGGALLPRHRLALLLVNITRLHHGLGLAHLVGDLATVLTRLLDIITNLLGDLVADQAVGGGALTVNDEAGFDPGHEGADLARHSAALLAGHLGTLLSGHLLTPGAGHGPTLLPGHQVTGLHRLRLAPLGVDSLALLPGHLVAGLPVHQLTLALLDLATLLLGHIATLLGEHVMAPLVISNRFANRLGHAATLVLVYGCALLAGNVLALLLLHCGTDLVQHLSALLRGDGLALLLELSVALLVLDRDAL